VTGGRLPVHPADGVRVVDVRLRELSGTPTVDWRSDVLLDADDNAEE